MTDVSPAHIPEGMMEIWTIERPTVVGEIIEGQLVEEVGVLIDALKDTEQAALTEIARLGPPWSTQRLVVPYHSAPKKTD